ncbi:MAG: murein biosynthesis integral membrane protein MurJ [Candidatus Cloacimonadales bacterium]
MSNKALAKNISIMSLAVSLSRVLGLVRDQVMGFFFGASYLNDAFQIAINIPNLLRSLFGEGALSAAFVPIYNQIGIKKGKEYQIKFALNMLSLLTLLLTFLTIIGMAFAPWIVRVISPGLPLQTSLLTIKLTRIIFPYLFFIGVSSTMISILNSHNKFFMTGLSSGLYNLGIIGSLLIPYFLLKSTPETLIYYAAIGVLVGGFLQTVINFPFLKQVGYSFRIYINLQSENLKILGKRFIPGVIGVGVRQINLLVDIFIASFLPLGYITCLRYGARLMQMPLGIFGISASTAVLPLFSKMIAEENWKELSERIRFTTISLLYLLIPITFFIAGSGLDVIKLLFERGSFDSLASQLTYETFTFYSSGLTFFALNQTLTPLFYAAGDTKTPVIISSLMVAANVILNVVLMHFFKHIGIALATSITGLIQMLVLIYVMKRKFEQIKIRSMVKNLLKITLLSLIIYGLVLTINYSIVGNSILLYITRLSLNGFTFLLVLGVGSYVLRLEYAEIIWKKLRIIKLLKKK